MSQDRFSQPIENDPFRERPEPYEEERCRRCGKSLADCRGDCERQTIPIACASPSEFCFELLVNTNRMSAAMTAEEHQRFPKGRWSD